MVEIMQVLNDVMMDENSYEPHLWENEVRHYQRCSVLFGFLIQLNRLYTDSPLKPSNHGDANTLNMTGPIPRFTYLPIRYAFQSFRPNGSE